MNKHVAEYCKKFISSKTNPHFAVLLKGDWGCGKTFFIKHLIEEMKLKKEDYVYVSLFGIKNLDQIDEKIFEAMHPILSSPKMKFLGSIAKSALRLGTNFSFDLNEDSSHKGFLNIDLKGLNTKGVEKISPKRNLLIVDDIERLGVGLNIKDVFGFFQDLISDSDVKVIFIGNEEKIDDGNSSESPYKKIKEKSIGQEFLIKPCVEDAISSFVNELAFKKKLKDVVENKTKEIVSNLKCNNLRVVRSVLWTLSECTEFLIKDLPESNWDGFVQSYLVLNIQKNLGDIEREHVLEALKCYEVYKIEYKSFDKSTMNVDFVNLNVPLIKAWPEIIFDGICTRDELNAKYILEKKEIINKGKKNELFDLISNWRDLKESDFKTSVDKLNKDFESGVYLHPGEILHYANIMLLFSKWGVRSETKQFVMNKIRELYKSHKVTYVENFEMLKMGFAGWSYSTGFSTFDDVAKLVSKKNDELQVQSKSQKVEISVNLLCDDQIDVFCKDLWKCNGTNKYYNF